MSCSGVLAKILTPTAGTPSVAWRATSCSILTSTPLGPSLTPLTDSWFAARTSVEMVNALLKSPAFVKCRRLLPSLVVMSRLAAILGTLTLLATTKTLPRTRNRNLDRLCLNRSPSLLHPWLKKTPAVTPGTRLLNVSTTCRRMCLLDPLDATRTTPASPATTRKRTLTSSTGTLKSGQFPKKN